MSEHHLYCGDDACVGCLPSDEQLQGMNIIELWGEMLARCIAQTPQTKTRDGAIAALVADGPEYRAREGCKR